MVYILLGEGFEELEAVAPIDILRRCGAEIKTVSLYSAKKLVKSSHEVLIDCDMTIGEVNENNADMIILPGGLGGVKEIMACAKALELIKKQHQSNKYIAAICAAPTILASLGILDGKHCTSHPTMRDKLNGAILSADNVCIDGNIITSVGAGTACEFGFTLAEILISKEKAYEVKNSMCFL